MATTIKLKNGSGAPLASDLVQGEPAFDLTNKRLYTEDSGGTVIEVGTTPTSLTTTGTVTFGSLSDGTITITAFVDEDNMVSDSATLVPTQQSVKAYVDSQVTAQDLDFQGDSGGALSIDLDSETLTIAGGTGIDTTGATNTLTVAIDSTVTTLTGTQTLTNKTLTSPVINTGVSGTAVLDDDTFATASATTLATSESIKAYVDSQVTAQDLDFQADSGGALSIDLDSETMTFTGGTGIDTSGSGNAVTFAIDSTVATLTGTQTLTNKTLTSPDINNPDIDGGTIDGTAIGGSSAAAGTFTTFTSTGIDDNAASTAITIDSSQDVTFTSDAKFPDNGKAIFGAGSDLQIYHDGTDSFIKESGAGSLKIWAKDFEVYNAGGTETLINADVNAGVQLYFDNATKLATASTGIDVTGTVTSDGLTVDGGNTLRLNAASTNDFFTITQGGTQAVLTADSDAAANMLFKTASAGVDTDRMQIFSNGDISFYEDTGTTQAFFWDASAESLGIGDTTPENKLTVVDTDAGSGIAPVKARTSTVNGRASYQIGNDADNWFMGIDGGNSDAFFISDAVGSSDRLVITQGGNVGIGTSSPATDLSVSSSGAEAKIFVGRQVTSGNLSNTAGGGSIEFGSADSSTYAEYSGASIKLVADQNWTVGSAQGSALAFSVTADGTASLSEAMRIDSNGRVGIGATNPASLLHLAKATGGDGSSPLEINIDSTFSGNWTADTDWGRINFRVPNEGSPPDGDTHIQIAANSGNSTAGSVNDLVFRVKEAIGGTLTERMRVDYDGTISFADKDASETMRIDSSGNLLVGKDVADDSTVGARFSNAGFMSLVRDGGRPLFIRRDTSDGDLVEFSRSGATVGSIGSEGGNTIYIVNGDTGLRFAGGSDVIVPSGANGAVRDGAIDLGLDSQRFKDLYLSGGAYLGGTGAANKLDDYEEGTWTPSFNSASFTASGVTSVSGAYVKIGDFVQVSFVIGFSGTSGNFAEGDAASIGGLPFNPVSFNGGGTANASQDYTNNVRMTWQTLPVGGSDDMVMIIHSGAGTIGRSTSITGVAMYSV